MKNLIRRLFGRPVELPVPPVTVPAPVGPARIATPAELRLAEAAAALADAKRAERAATDVADRAYDARTAAEAELRKAIEEVSRP